MSTELDLSTPKLTPLSRSDLENLFLTSDFEDLSLTPRTPVQSPRALENRLISLQDTHPNFEPPVSTFPLPLHGNGGQPIRRQNATIILSDVYGRQAMQVDGPALDRDLPPCLSVEHPVYDLRFSPSRETFHEVNVQTRLISEYAWDVCIPSFNPDKLWTHIKLWTQVQSWESNGGLTETQFTLFCARCVLCDRFMSQHAKEYHKCPTLESLVFSVRMEDPRVLFDKFREIEGPGITIEEFQYLFVKRSTCGRILTRNVASDHEHGDDEMVQE